MQVLCYNSLTGSFSWRQNISKKHHIGDSAGRVMKAGYIQIQIDGKAYLAHRLAWLIHHGVDPGTNEIDHIDGVHGNNAALNLRLANREQNSKNLPKMCNNSSGFTGVVRSRGKWQAQIAHNRKRHYLGRFDTKEEAAQAYRDASTRLYGAFSPFNSRRTK